MSQYFDGDVVVSGNIEIRSLTQTNIDNKQITLQKIPLNPTNTIVFPSGGLVQIYGVDYAIVGNIIYWNNLGLANFLEVGELLVIIYN